MASEGDSKFVLEFQEEFPERSALARFITKSNRILKLKMEADKLREEVNQLKREFPFLGNIEGMLNKQEKKSQQKSETPMETEKESEVSSSSTPKRKEVPSGSSPAPKRVPKKTEKPTVTFEEVPPNSVLHTI